MSTSITLPTYPARPVNGGPFNVALQLDTLPPWSEWDYTVKDNGWRTPIHIPTGAMFNRQGERLSIEAEFREALAVLRATLDCEAFKWADCEGLNRRHTIGRGCLVVIDVIPEPAYASRPYTERRDWLGGVLPEHDLLPTGKFPLLSRVPSIPPSLEMWQKLQAINRELGCEFYEGFVRKHNLKPYPFQLRNPEVDFPYWVKHRWAF